MAKNLNSSPPHDAAYLVALLILVGIDALLALPAMWMWNVALVPLMPTVIKTVGWMQMWGIMILFNFLSGRMYNTQK